MISFNTNGLFIKDDVKSFTILQITNAICDIIPKNSKVLLGRDTRCGNRDFVEIATKICLSRNLQVECIDLPIGASIFSYYLKETNKYSIGIYFTASTYPFEYQGLKLYNKNGKPIEQNTLNIIKEKANINLYTSNITKRIKLKNYFISKEEIENSYINSTGWQYNNKVILHYSCGYGTGLSAMPKAIKSLVIDETTKDQIIDQFTNIEKTNPKNISAYIDSELCISLVTNPECTEVGIREYGKYINKNDLTALFLDYFIQKQNESMYGRKLYKNTTTSMLSETIAKEYDIDIVNISNGTKNIVDYNESGDFLFGVEENSGFILGQKTNESCGIITARVISEMIDYWSKRDTTLTERLRFLKKNYLDIEEYTISKNDSLENIIKEYSQGYVYVSRINGLTKMLKNNKKGLIYIEQSNFDKNKCNIYVKNLNR